MKNVYQIYEFTNPNRKDSRRINGDFYLWKEIKDEGLLFLVIADGVGSTDKHWVASKMICELSYQYFTENEMNFNDIQQRLSFAIEKANNEIYIQKNDFLSTLCIALYHAASKELHYVWLGDSRIYKAGEKFEQLTQDQKESQLVRLNNEPLVINGSLQYRPVITNAIGYQNIMFDIKKTILNPGDSVLLMTDGFYETISIAEAFENKISKRNFAEHFNSICQQVADENIDDATILILKIENEDEGKTSNIIRKVIIQLHSNDKKILIAELDKLLQENDVTIIDFKQLMDEFAKSINFNNDVEVYQKILKLKNKLK